MGNGPRRSRRKARTRNPVVSGGDFEEATPDPIPNSEVKLFGANGTARVAVWESRTPPGFFPKEARETAPCATLELFAFCLPRWRRRTRARYARARELCHRARRCGAWW